MPRSDPFRDLAVPERGRPRRPAPAFPLQGRIGRVEGRDIVVDRDFRPFCPSSFVFLGVVNLLRSRDDEEGSRRKSGGGFAKSFPNQLTLSSLKSIFSDTGKGTAISAADWRSDPHRLVRASPSQSAAAAVISSLGGSVAASQSRRAVSR